MKKGLILEGGALRALFSAGVTDVMMEHGIAYDGMIGVSAGSAFGCNYKSHQPGRVIRYNKLLAHDWRFFSFRSWLVTGDYFGGDFDYHYMPAHIDRMDIETFTADPMEFHLVCTDLSTGRAVYKQLTGFTADNYDEVAEWFRASASMPLAAKVVEIEGHKYLDGGIADSIPLAYFQSLGYDRNVVVETQPDGYVKRPNRLVPLYRLVYRKYPAFVRASAERHLMYNRQLAYVREQEQAGRAFVIRPKRLLPIGHMTHDTRLMDEVYQEGRTTALERMEALKEYLGI